MRKASSKKRKMLLLSLFIFVAPASIKSRDMDFSATGLLNEFGNDAIYIFSSPLRMDEDDFFRLIFLGSVSAGLIFSGDEYIENAYDETERAFPLGLPNTLGSIGKIYDSGYTYIGLAAGIPAVFFYARSKGNDKLAETCFMMAESFIITKAFTEIGKFTLGRSRPYLGDGSHRFEFFHGTKSDFRSLPSGHASSIYSLLTIIGKQYSSTWVKIPVYSFAISVALQRIYDRKHWPSDTILGGALGYFTAKMIVDRHQQKDTGAAFVPVISPYGFGIRIYF